MGGAAVRWPCAHCHALCSRSLMAIDVARPRRPLGYDVLVIGDGVLGMAVAHRLKTRDSALRIGVVGPGDGAGAAAAASGAMLGAVGEVDRHTLRLAHRRHKFELGLAALRAWPDWLDQLADRAEMTAPALHKGTFLILNAAGGAMD